MTTRLPALFIGHGSPMNTLANSHTTQAWRALAASFPTPKAILMVSAHWRTHGIAVTAMPQPRTIHDFGGFPQALFDYQYPAPGSVSLAARVAQILAPKVVTQDSAWGLDHGAWSVLAHMYPKADVPVVQLSLDATQTGLHNPQFHYQLGQQLRALRDEGILIISSGNVVHNLGMMQNMPGKGFDWAMQFDARVQADIRQHTHQNLVDYAKLPHARLAVPSDEHYLPLLYTLGAQHTGEAVSFPVQGFDMGGISMLSVRVG